MANLEWRNRLLHELKRRKLPDSYTVRLIEELTDHFTDIQKENLSMDALVIAEQKLGTPESLAEAAKNEYRKRTFAGRYPFVVFALLPIPVVILALLAVLIPSGLIKSWITPMEPLNPNSPTLLEWGFAYVSVYTLRSIPFILAAWPFMILGRRVNRPAWGMIACGLVAVVAVVVRFNVLPPDGKHNLLICFSPALDLWYVNSRLFQAAIPLAIGIWNWRQIVRSHENTSFFHSDQLSSSSLT